MRKEWRSVVTLNSPIQTMLVLGLLALGQAIGGTSTVFAQFDFSGGFSTPQFPGMEVKEPVEVAAQFTPASAERPALLMITAKIAQKFHVYSVTQPSGGPLKSEVQLTPSAAYKQIGSFRSHPEPHIYFDSEVFNIEVQEHEGTVTWYAPIEIAEGVDINQLIISGLVKMQACGGENGQCINLKPAFEAKQGVGVPIGKLDFAPLTGSVEATSAPVADHPAPLKTGEQVYNLSAIEFGHQSEERSLWQILSLAFFGGMILNLMPCVLPVIGLKVMSFVSQAGKSRTQALLLNGWYSLGIMTVFWVLALLAVTIGLSWGEQFGNATFLIVMASIVFVMALSLLGVWEIPIHEAVGRTAAHEAVTREGPVGAYLKGVLTTMLATPCTGPGMAVALGWAVRQPALTTMTVFTALGIGMASPYLLIGAFPKLVGFLPKPGDWMVTFKQFMGFVLLGTVIFLLWLVPSHYLLPTLAFLTTLGLACWVYANTPLSASVGEKSQSWALCGAIVVAGAVFSYAGLLPLLMDDHVEWESFSLVKLNELTVDEGKTVLVDFGASWCANCQVLEQTVLHTDSVESAIKRAGVVPLFADNTEYPPEIESTLSALRSNGVPVIAIFPGADPYRPIVFRGIYTQGQLVEAIAEATSRKPSVATVRRGEQRISGAR